MSEFVKDLANHTSVSERCRFSCSNACIQRCFLLVGRQISYSWCPGSSIANGMDMQDNIICPVAWQEKKNREPLV